MYGNKISVKATWRILINLGKAGDVTPIQMVASMARLGCLMVGDYFWGPPGPPQQLIGPLGKPPQALEKPLESQYRRYYPGIGADTLHYLSLSVIVLFLSLPKA